ncbi:MAG: hypothetical protein ACXAAH_16780 [Promethearchaeota archaeon]|jgi:hypothetical protein
MATTKSKSVIIDGETHAKFKKYCKERSLKIGGVIENLIEIYLHDPQKIEDLIQKFREVK